MQQIKGSTLRQKDSTKRPCDSLTLCMGYTGTFGKRGNVRQGICIAGPQCRFPYKQWHFPDQKDLSCGFWRGWKGRLWVFL
ncbi:hypothetical protein PGTDC60_0403 [Porphyromonas gingivalis TDC60]|nr:hypothetical protein PGTDC60_0403 [Porphyromonas gingivalis TDC60]